MADLERNPLLRDVFDIPEVVSASDYVLQLHTGVDHAGQTVAEYVATESLAEAFDDALGYVGAAVDAGKPQGVFLHGTFGSGKSHFMAILDLMLRGESRARAIPGLQAVVAKHARTLERNLLTVEYHLIGAKSLEEAVLAGFARRIAELHPDHPAPMLHKSDQLFADAEDRRDEDEVRFFARLNQNVDGAGGGWGAYAAGWTPESYDRARDAPATDADRVRLANDLVRTMFTGYAAAGEWLDIADGLHVMATTAEDLGYEGLVLFLDELVLWLASHANNPEFVSREASKVAKLVESGLGNRAVPMVSFVARQRELSDFIGDRATGVQRAQVGEVIRYWEDRFDRITLSAANLPDVAHKRLLMPVSAQAAERVAAAVAAVKASDSWNVLLSDSAQADEAAFTKVYPFSPALVDVLVALSGRLQRERTALKVMALLLSARRDSGRIDEVIGVGDLYDQMVAGGEQPLSEEMKTLFATARALYDNKFRPLLLAEANLTEEPEDPQHQFHKNARLAKTMIIAAMVPEVKSLSRLTAGRLAALNHGTVQAFIPGEEATQVLHTVRGWAQRIGEIHIGEGNDPVLSVELSGVNYESVLELVQHEDTPGARRQLLKRLVFAEMGIEEPAQVAIGLTIDRTWRGTRRQVDVVFGNIRDNVNLPDAKLQAEGDRWKMVIDYPFDEGDHGPQEDVNRLTELRVGGQRSRTVGWVPYFLTTARLDDLGELVVLEHLLGGTGGQFDANASHLPVEQRPFAKQQLQNMRRAKSQSVRNALRQAYGLDAPDPTVVDAIGYGEITQFPTLWRDEPLRRPGGASLQEALDGLIDQMLSEQFPDHPRFEYPDREIRAVDLKHMWEIVQKAAASPNGRLDPVDTNRRALVRRLASPLGLGHAGESHFVFNKANFTWSNEFVRLGAADSDTGGIPVSELLDVLAARGLNDQMAKLIVASFALLEDKQVTLHGGAVALDPTRLNRDMMLVDPRLPDADAWVSASRRASALFGISAGKMRNAANTAALAGALRAAVAERASACDNLVQELESHALTLGLDADAPRLATAREAQSLLAGLNSAADDVALVEALAGLDLPDEVQPLATSMTSAPGTVAALRRQDWSALDAAASKADTDDKAAAVLKDLRATAKAEELHDKTKLAAALPVAQQRATQWLLDQRVDPTPPPPPPLPPIVDPDEVVLSLETLDEQIHDVKTAIRKELQADTGRRVKIRWWLE